MLGIATIATVVILVISAILAISLAITPKMNEIGGVAEEAPGRYNQVFARGPNRFNTIQLWPKIWDIDGTHPPVQGTSGTDGQWVRTTLQFAVATNDEIAYVDFTIPADYNEGENELWLALLVNADDTDNTHHGDWDGVVRRIPFSAADSEDCELVDPGAWGTYWTGLTVAQELTDDTPNEAYGVLLDLSVVSWKKCDMAQIAIFNDVSASDLGNEPLVHNAFALARR